MKILFDRWYNNLGAMPNFSNNRVSWLAIAIIVVILPAQTLTNLVVFASVASMTAATAISLMLIGWGESHVVLSIVAGSWLAVLAITVPLFVFRLNSALN